MADPTVGVIHGSSNYVVLLLGDTMRFRFAAYDRVDGVLTPMDLTVFDSVNLAVMSDRAAGSALWVFPLTVLTDPADQISGVSARCQTTNAYLNPAGVSPGNVECRVFGKIGASTFKTIGKFWKAGLYDTGPTS